MKKVLIINVAIVLSFSLLGQEAPTALKQMHDSLKYELKQAKVDSVKMEILLLLSESSNYKDPDSSIYYGEKALKLAKKYDDIPVQMGAMAFMGSAYKNKGNLPKSLELGLEAIELGKDLPIRMAGGIGPNYSNLGEIYYEIKDYKKATAYFRKMTSLGENDLLGVAYGYYDLARIKERLNQLDSARIYLNKSFQTFAKIEFSYYPYIYHVYPPWYNLRAKVLLKENKADLALTDYFTSLKMTLRSGDEYHTSNSYNDIAKFYETFNRSDSVIFYAEKGLNAAKTISYSRGILDASEILARQFESDDPATALRYFKLATRTQNELYGAGNLQVLRDMIDQEEKRQDAIEAARSAYQNKIKMNSILGIAFTILGFAVFLLVLYKRNERAKKKIESAFKQLKSTQQQLVQSEKMASLGELTAGIAHEIQNPLNFVNNFSELNAELIDEVEEEIEKEHFPEVKEILQNIKENEQKIGHHGKRAESIVKGMLMHSRGNTGEKELTDLNLLCDEYLRLSYHGFRAKDKSFNADFKLEADESLPKIEIVPQDIGRVLLNLMNNAFYAVADKARNGIAEFKPLVKVGIKMLEHKIEIFVEDNGGGIPKNIKDKIFQPFFTTKPTGTGTGLGLSLSYDIIKAHGGQLTVETEDGIGTIFKIKLPLHK